MTRAPYRPHPHAAVQPDAATRAMPTFAGQLGFTPAERDRFDAYRLERRAKAVRDGWEPIWRGWMTEDAA